MQHVHRARLLGLGMIGAAAVAAAGAAEPAGEPAGEWKVRPAISGVQQVFPQGSVRILESPFKTMQDVDHAYLMRLEPDRLLAQFRVEAGLEPKAKPYGGWESPAQPGKTWSLAGHSLGHYLSAISLMYRITGDYRLKERAAYICREWKECQDKRGDGSLVAFPYARELEAEIRAGKVEIIHKYWAPFYTIHKQMAGLRDAWRWCHDETARDVLVGLADWCGSLIKGLTDEQRERMLGMEHGGMPEVMADVYAITGEPRHLEFARLYSHRLMLDPAARGEDNLTGKHANTQVPKFTGFQRIHELTGDADFGAAARFFWKTVIENRTWVNGANSMHEYFFPVKEMRAHITHDAGPETCNTYNMLRLTTALYRETPDPAYLDYYENALFNHILSSQAPLVGAGAFVYYTPLRPDFARSYGTDFTCFWCCTGTGMENHALYGELIYTHDGKALSVNLFIPSTLEWAERGLSLRQETKFPEEPGTALVITRAPAEPVTLRIRHPAWVAAARPSVQVNGQAVEAAVEKGFVAVTRAWKPGDRVQVALPMQLRVVRQPQCEGWVSLFYGPILLAGELGAEGLTQRDFIGQYTPVKALRPLARAPVMLAVEDKDILARIEAVPGRPCVFRTKDGLVKPGEVTLSPFYQLHFQRYAVYWQLSDQASWEKQRQEIEAAERIARELDERTIDRVRIGEQQPEIDHDLKFDKSTSGGGPQGRRFREARDGGWFSYVMKLPPAGTPVVLYAVYWGRDSGREFEIQVDGVAAATQSLRGGKDDYFGVEYALKPELLTGKDKITVRFQSKPEGIAGGVFDVRVLRAK